MYKRKMKIKKQVKQFEDHLSIEELKSLPLYLTVEENTAFLKEVFKDSSDVVIRQFDIEKGPKALVVYVDGLANTDSVDQAVKSIMITEGEEFFIKRVMNTTLPVTQITDIDNFGDLIHHILSGDTAFMVDRNKKAYALGLRGSEHRSVSEPETESVIRGPREGFNENLRTCTALIRKKIRSPRLKMMPMVVGKETHTDIVISYIDGLADPDLVEEVIGRIQKIDIDGVLETGYIEELIQDNGFSPFPQMQYTERPDTVAASLLEGRVAILVDGTPFVLLAPIVFWQWIQASEDYYERFLISSMLRILRLLFLFVALTTPAFYVAVTTFHQEMIPTSLLLSIAASREPIPFPAIIEALIMEISFEALREAGLRLPKAIGQSVSILGALVVGQAAVQAGIVSAAMVIVVSITGIASFTIPRYNAAIAIRMLRFPLMILASLFGLFGIVIGLTIIMGHLSKLRSFGVPYLSGLGPVAINDLKDVPIRSPWWAMKQRPAFLEVSERNRFGEGEGMEDIAKEKGQTGAKVDHDQQKNK